MMSVKKIVLLGCAMLLFATAPPAFSQTVNSAAPIITPAATVEKTVEISRAAKVVLVDGAVAVYSSARQRRALAVDDYVFEGDSIITGNDGELHLDMEDGGYMSVRPNTKMRIAKYRAKGDAGDTAVFRLFEGSLRSVTGWIGQFNRNNYLVRTPNATVGIRGTDHEPLVIVPGSGVGEPGTYDKVNEGGSYIQTPAGRAEVAPSQAGFVGHDKGAVPRILKEIPSHFRAGRFDQRFLGKHAEVVARIEKRRDSRRTEIRQKRQGLKTGADAGLAQSPPSLQGKPAAALKTDGVKLKPNETALNPREAARQSREAARMAREAARKEKEDKRKAAQEEAESEKAEKAEQAAKMPRKAHPTHK